MATLPPPPRPPGTGRKKNRAVTVRGRRVRLTPAQEREWARRVGMAGPVAGRSPMGGPDVPGRGMAAGGVRTGVVRPPGFGAPVAPGAAPGGGAAAPDPLAHLPQWARDQIGQIDRDRDFHMRYLGFNPDGTGTGPGGAAGGVAGWLQGAQQGLGQFATDLAGMYNQQVALGPGQALAQSAGAGIPAVQMPGGGSSFSPTSFTSDASRGLDMGRATAAQDAAAYEAKMGGLEQVIRAQASLRTMADFAKGLPATYAQRRNETRVALERYVADEGLRLAQFEEQKRANRVQEGISTWNAQTNAAIGFANLGMDAQELAGDQAAAAASGAQPLPDGFVYVPDGKGGQKPVRDPSYVKPGTGADKAPSSQTADGLKRDGWQKVGPGRNVKSINKQQWQVFTAKDTGEVFIKRRAGAGSAPKPPAAKPVAELGTKLLDLYKGKTDGITGARKGGIASRHPGDREGASEEVVDWVLTNKAQFTTGGKVDLPRLAQVLKTGLGDSQGTSVIIGIIRDKLNRRIKNGRWV